MASGWLSPSFPWPLLAAAGRGHPRPAPRSTGLSLLVPAEKSAAAAHRPQINAAARGRVELDDAGLQLAAATAPTQRLRSADRAAERGRAADAELGLAPGALLHWGQNRLPLLIRPARCLAVDVGENRKGTLG